MPCSSRLTRQGIFSGPAAGPAVVAFAFLAGAILLQPGLAGASPRSHPPGRPGLPLPLFLGVSRT